MGNKSNYAPLDQILANVIAIEGEETYNKYTIELFHLVSSHINKICDINDCMGEDTLLYRLNEGKVLSWLKKKVKYTEIILHQIEKEESQMLLLESKNTNFSESFNFNKKNEDLSTSELKALAFKNV